MFTSRIPRPFFRSFCSEIIFRKPGYYSLSCTVVLGHCRVVLELDGRACSPTNLDKGTVKTGTFIPVVSGATPHCSISTGIQFCRNFAAVGHPDEWVESMNSCKIERTIIHRIPKTISRSVLHINKRISTINPDAKRFIFQCTHILQSPLVIR